MRKIILIAFFILFSLEVVAQDYLYGNEGLCSTELKTQTKAPKGFKPFYLSHYGRHGARYAWQSEIYKDIKMIFDTAYVHNNLSLKGHEFKKDFDVLYPSVKYRAGELSRKGWQQQQELAVQMVTYYPEIFTKEADIQAYTSSSGRCIMSMSAFCLSLMQQNSRLNIFENCGYSFLEGVLPLNRHNPFRNQDYIKSEIPFDETLEEFIDRKIDYKPILERLFLDADKALIGKNPWDFVFHLFVFANGIRSLDTELDFTDVFTLSERIALWEINNFQFYIGALPNHKAYQTVVDDIITKAEKKISAKGKGADLRFSHDDALLSLMMLLGVNDFATTISNPDDISKYCSMHHIPMGANLHFVLYCNKESDKILFKVLLNGEETRISMPTDIWPYYDWNEFKNIQKK